LTEKAGILPAIKAHFFKHFFYSSDCTEPALNFLPFAQNPVSRCVLILIIPMGLVGIDPHSYFNALVCESKKIFLKFFDILALYCDEVSSAGGHPSLTLYHGEVSAS